MKAVILGATGLVGSKLLDLLLTDNSISEVTALIRREIPLEHSKLNKVLCDFTNLEAQKDYFKVDTLFCCLGTTIKTAGSKEAFRFVDYELPLKAGKLFKQMGGKHYLLISALGANSVSPFFYNQVKGEIERDLKELDLPKITICRPSLLLGERQESRTLEGIGQKLIPLANSFLKGKLQKYQGIDAIEVAKAMLNEAKSLHQTSKMEVETL